MSRGRSLVPTVVRGRAGDDRLQSANWKSRSMAGLRGAGGERQLFLTAELRSIARQRPDRAPGCSAENALSVGNICSAKRRLRFRPVFRDPFRADDPGDFRLRSSRWLMRPPRLQQRSVSLHELRRTQVLRNARCNEARTLARWPSGSPGQFGPGTEVIATLELDSITVFAGLARKARVVDGHCMKLAVLPARQLISCRSTRLKPPHPPDPAAAPPGERPRCDLPARSTRRSAESPAGARS